MDVVFNSNKFFCWINQALITCVSRIICVIETLVPSKFSDKIRILRSHEVVFYNVIGLTFFNSLGGLLTILTQVKLANVMGASHYGVYSYCLAIGEVGAMVVRYGRHKTMVRDLIQYPVRNLQLISSTFIIGVINFLIFLGLVLVFHQDIDIQISVGTVLLICGACLISLDFQPVYVSLNAMSWHSMYNLFQKLIFVIILWGIMLSPFTLSLNVLGIVFFFSWILVIVWQYKEITSFFHLKIISTCEWSKLFKLYRENFVVAFSCLFGIAFGPIIRIVLNNYCNSREVGVFSAGLQILLIAQFILNQIGRIGNPMMAIIGKDNCSMKQRRLFVYRYLFIMLSSTLPFFIPFFFFPSLVVNMFFTEEYADLVIMLPILAVYLIALSVGVVYTQFLISMRKDRLYFIIYVLGATLTILCAFLLIPILGILGATLSLCVPHALTCLCYWWFSANLLRK